MKFKATWLDQDQNFSTHALHPDGLVLAAWITWNTPRPHAVSHDHWKECGDIRDTYLLCFKIIHRLIKCYF